MVKNCLNKRKQQELPILLLVRHLLKELHKFYLVPVPYSFISTSFARTPDRPQDKLGHRFTTTLPSGEILVWTHWLQVVSMSISGRVVHRYDIIGYKGLRCHTWQGFLS